MAIPRIASRLFFTLPLSIPQGVRGFSPNKAVAVRPFSYSARNGSPKTDILVELAKARRTVYQLGSNSPVPDSEIEKLVHAAILNVPSAFNTQSTRLLVLLHREHERLWDVAIEVFKNLLNTGAIPKEVWERQTLPKLQGFRAGVGTPWAEHSNAMHQFFRASDPRLPTFGPILCFWTGLESLGFAANLQHYNPLIDGPVAKQWDIPSEWKLVAQLVFGSPKGVPGEKSQKPIEDRVKIYGRR
ncbi:hypothetical protein AN1853.2 [Aspergillus nidulans FGSC A4]|nr:hypothetical protein AN1853.2 [Aspergillus nidulans FGSC A4]|eukprot:XP_659457.1 hypothetical protein AN1853.2 [Aspergillus nidulans FGSC A4]